MELENYKVFPSGISLNFRKIILATSEIFGLHIPVMCLSIGTPKTINFPFVAKLVILGVPKFGHFTA